MYRTKVQHGLHCVAYCFFFSNKKADPPEDESACLQIVNDTSANSAELMVSIVQVSFYAIRKNTQIRKQKVPPAKRQTVQRTYTRFFFTMLQRILGIASKLLISRKLLPNSSWILGFESPIPAPITITPSCCNFLMTSRTVSP